MQKPRTASAPPAGQTGPAVATANVVIPANVDVDEAFQGDYAGGTLTAKLGREDAGLRVTALGGGEFRAVQYRQGLPEAGWNGADRITLDGQRVGDTLRLAAHGRRGTYTITIRNGVAQLRNAGGQSVGSLQKVEPNRIARQPADNTLADQAAWRAASDRR